MDVPILSTFLSPILTVASVWNTGETGDIYVVKISVIFTKKVAFKFYEIHPWTCLKTLELFFAGRPGGATPGKLIMGLRIFLCDQVSFNSDVPMGGRGRGTYPMCKNAEAQNSIMQDK